VSALEGTNHGILDLLKMEGYEFKCTTVLRDGLEIASLSITYAGLQGIRLRYDPTNQVQVGNVELLKEFLDRNEIDYERNLSSRDLVKQLKANSQELSSLASKLEGLDK
jgi:hypothetical protein